MPTLRETTHKQPFPEELTGTSVHQGITTDDRIRSEITPAASTGNTTKDHMEDVKARLGHFTDTEIYKDEYDNSATYAIGDEVHWLDPNNDSRKGFYKRLTAGDDGGSGTPISDDNAANWDFISTDVHNIRTTDEPITDENAAGLWQTRDGAVFWNRRVAKMLLAAQNVTEVLAAINTEVAKLVTDSRWRGTWVSGTAYALEQYVLHSSQYYKCIVARGTSDTTAPNSDSTGWVRITGVELDIAKRLENMAKLLANIIDLPTPATGNRGRWVERAPNGEGFQYHNPPMQWMGNWNSSARYYYGDVVIWNNGLWVVHATSAITTAVHTSVPGTTHWTELTVGHSSDIPGFRGEWSSIGLNDSVRVGDLVSAGGNYYICKAAHNRSGTGPADDSLNWDLLDAYQGTYATNKAYHEGAIVQYTDTTTEVYLALSNIENSDPLPSARSNTKWKQISGTNQEDLAQLRKDLTTLQHGALTTRGQLVSSLDEPATVNSPSLVWLPAKSFRNFTAPASQIHDISDRGFAQGDEAGEYRKTTGTLNRAQGVIGKHTDSDTSFVSYAIYDKFGTGASLFAADMGRWTHNPMGSVIAGVGVVQTAANTWQARMQVKENWWYNVTQGSNPATNLWLRIWNADGTGQTAINMNSDRGTVYHQDVLYREMHGTVSDSAAFGTIFEAGTDTASRTIEVGFSLTESGSAVYLGNRTTAWTKQPPPAAHQDLPVFSQHAHSIVKISQADYTALTVLEPLTIYLIHA